MKQYASTKTLCEIYEVGKEFFTRRIDKEFFLNEHFIKKSNTLRWDAEAIEQWWRGSSATDTQTEDILNRILAS